MSPLIALAVDSDMRWAIRLFLQSLACRHVLPSLGEALQLAAAGVAIVEMQCNNWHGMALELRRWLAMSACSALECACTHSALPTAFCLLLAMWCRPQLPLPSSVKVFCWWPFPCSDWRCSSVNLSAPLHLGDMFFYYCVEFVSCFGFVTCCKCF